MGRRAAPGPGPPPPWPRPRLPPLPWLLLALATRGGWGAPAPRAEDLSLGVEWLSRFGYLPPADSTTGQLQTQEELSKAIAAMQRFGGLEATGILDVATLALMKTPRCSLPDLPAAAPARRRRQAPAPTTWHKRSLSWRVRTFPRDSPLGPDTVRALMHYALKVWSDITPLNFHEVAGSAADIQIDFSKADHNDAYPFDGPGGTVAHAFFPGDHHTAGDAHFDDDESWAFRSSDAHDMDLFAVAVHEFGHAIGLSHVAATSSIMQPYYQGPVGDPLHYRLPYEDRVRIWQLYGVRESVSPTAQPDTPEPKEPPLLPEPPNNRSSTLPRKDVPHRCSTDFDAVAQIRGEAFFFKGKYFWRLTRDGHLVSLQPAQMHRFWRGLPLQLDSVDAVYERTSDHKIVFFKGLCLPQLAPRQWPLPGPFASIWPPWACWQHPGQHALGRCPSGFSRATSALAHSAAMPRRDVSRAALPRAGAVWHRSLCSPGQVDLPDFSGSHHRGTGSIPPALWVLGTTSLLTLGCLGVPCTGVLPLASHPLGHSSPFLSLAKDF
ncbi:matrix metalloproteinase-17 isoform X2 [Canis lupus dingo]|uniref:matrix metalloproteinase-17 isoform X2 n=1 Tax=Canis lupus dingo TaxID=286419 RepID=UPI000DC6AA62|nr:matrix metalloproteinase-17 isoform X2 [Canis lupus dingo]